MQVGLGHPGEVEVDDDVDGLDVDAPGEEVGADEVAAQPGPEVVEDAVPVRLGHAGVDVVAGVAELGDLLGEELHSLGGVAENDALIDLKKEIITKSSSCLGFKEFLTCNFENSVLRQWTFCRSCTNA